jgi:hypothetical protein
MWHPKQLLRDDVVQTLREAEFSESQIEYLGWLSYNAAAINKSMNPAKAATTILNRAMLPSKPKKGDDTRPMLEKFFAKQKDSIQPDVDLDNDVRQAFQKFDKWKQRVEAEHPSIPNQPFVDLSADEEITEDPEN